MQEIIPTDEEVWKALRQDGCCWLTKRKYDRFGKPIGCECYGRTLKSCFEEKKKELTYFEKTEEEIQKEKEEHEKFMDNFWAALDELNGGN